MKFIFLIIVFPLILFSQKKYENNLIIHLDHLVENHTLMLDKVIYYNQLNQPYTITKFKYYLSNIILTSKKGMKSKNKEVFLIDEENSSSEEIILSKIKKGVYDSISFIIGVDSLRNCSGAQSGALDPINTMFWTWNTGYIFLKLEGKSPLSSASGKIIEYHIGGYKDPVNAIEKVQLALSYPLDFTKGNEQTISVNVNIAEIFRVPTEIDFSKLPSVTDTKNALLISRNYKDMFSIK